MFPLSSGVVALSLSKCFGFCLCVPVGADGVWPGCGIGSPALVHLQMFGCLGAAWFVSLGYLMLGLC